MTSNGNIKPLTIGSINRQCHDGLKAKKILVFFILGLSVSFIMANVKTYDSGHMSVEINSDTLGIGRPLKLSSGIEEYKIAVSGKYSGAKQNVKIELLGDPKIAYEIYSMYPPTVQLRRWYSFDNNILYGISNGDKFRLFLIMNPKSHGNYNLTFFDALSNKTLLKVPITIGEEAEHNHRN